MPETIDLTPPAFNHNNPKAKENLQKARDAAVRLERVIRAKVQFLDELVKEQFGGAHGLEEAVILRLTPRRLSGINARAVAREVRDEYLALQKEHDAAGQALHDSFAA